MNNNFWIVDIFGANKFEGTPASVFFVDDFLDDSLMQNLAMELNTPETVFVKELQNGDYEIQCFTPISKGLYFGNALFAASKIIREEKKIENESINLIFGTRIFVATFLDENKIKIRFSKAKLNKVKVPSELSSAINGELIVSIVESKGDIITELRGPTKLINITPNFEMLKSLEYNSVIFTADPHYDTDSDYDFCAKVYSPKLGLFRSIATPMAYVKLASYWEERAEKQELIGFQISRNRNSYSYIQMDDMFTFVTADCFVTTKGEVFL